jgi:hypothetical protein
MKEMLLGLEVARIFASYDAGRLSRRRCEASRTAS